MTSFMHKYMDQVVLLATRKVAVRSVLLQVMSMVLPPSALFRPPIFLRVLVQGLAGLTRFNRATTSPGTRGRFSYQAQE